MSPAKKRKGQETAHRGSAKVNKRVQLSSPAQVKADGQQAPSNQALTDILNKLKKDGVTKEGCEELLAVADRCARDCKAAEAQLRKAISSNPLSSYSKYIYSRRSAPQNRVVRSESKRLKISQHWYTILAHNEELPPETPVYSTRSVANRFVVGNRTFPRPAKGPVYLPREIVEHVAPLSKKERCAVLAAWEKRGLILVGQPTAKKYVKNYHEIGWSAVPVEYGTSGRPPVMPFPDLVREINEHFTLKDKTAGRKDVEDIIVEHRRREAEKKGLTANESDFKPSEATITRIMYELLVMDE